MCVKGPLSPLSHAAVRDKKKAGTASVSGSTEPASLRMQRGEQELPPAAAGSRAAACREAERSPHWERPDGFAADYTRGCWA